MIKKQVEGSVVHLATSKDPLRPVLDGEGLADYHRHPDEFAARHFGVSHEQYRAWVLNCGFAICEALLHRRRTPYRNLVGKPLSAQDHACMHQLVYCKKHSARPHK